MLFLSTGWVLPRAAPTLYILHIIMKITMSSFFINVCERLFDELIKEMLQNRYTIVSASFREAEGRKVRVKKAHLRRKR
jgi:hypothetical protein